MMQIMIFQQNDMTTLYYQLFEMKIKGEIEEIPKSLIIFAFFSLHLSKWFPNVHIELEELPMIISNHLRFSFNKQFETLTEPLST